MAFPFPLFFAVLMSCSPQSICGVRPRIGSNRTVKENQREKKKARQLTAQLQVADGSPLRLRAQTACSPVPQQVSVVADRGSQAKVRLV